MRYTIKERKTGNSLAYDEMPYSELREIVRDMSGNPDKKLDVLVDHYGFVAVIYMDKGLDLDDLDIR